MKRLKEKETEFDEYKNEYSKEDTNDSRKEELISKMKQNIQERIADLTSKDVEVLYAIDSILREYACKVQMSEVAEKAKEMAESQNKYGPNNPYPSK